MKNIFYELKVTQFLEFPIEKVFHFFSNAKNLERITPTNLHFVIKTPLPICMKQGTIIDFGLRIRGIPTKWSSLISSYNPPNSFIDEQIKGPYLTWNHTHIFKEENGGTTIVDKVKYSIPFGLLGRIINYLWVKKDLEAIFNYRSKTIKQIFNNYLE